MNFKQLLIISFILFSYSASAQFEIRTVIRPRFEFRNGYNTLRNDTTTPAAFVSQRTRLNFSYKTKKIETKLSFFDFRVWGDQVWKKDIASMGLNEAWVKININNYWSIKFGRQKLKYDNNRLISPVNWNQIGAAHDVFKINFNKNSWVVDFDAAWNQSSQNKFGTDYYWMNSFYKSLYILWLSKKYKNFTISSLNISDGYQDEINAEIQHYRFTYGFIPDYKNKKLQITGRIFGQTGHLQTGRNILAYYTNLDFSYTVSDKMKFIAGNEIKSGNNALDSLNTTDNSFNILYGAKHKFNGRIDYFSLPSTTNGAGFIDSYLKANYKFSESTSLLTEYHYFMLQNNFIYEGSVMDKFLGHEIDFIYKQKIKKDIRLEAGYSCIFGTKSLDIIKNGNSNLWNNWFYFMITVDPSFFINKDKTD